MVSKKPSILIVDDEQVVCDVLYEELTERGYLCTAVLTGNDALAKLDTEDFDVVLLDIRLPGISGLEVLTKIRSNHRSTAAIMVTAVNDVGTAVVAMKLGALDYIVKPFDLDRVATGIRTALETKKSLIEYEERLTEEAEEFTSMPEEMQLVILPPIEAKQLMRFASQVEEILRSRVLQVVGSWQEGTAMTVVLPQAAPMADILNKLEEMPEIEKISEKPLNGEASPGLLKRVAAVPRLKDRPRKTVFVTLKKGEAGQTQEQSIRPEDNVYSGATSAHTRAQ